MIQKVLETILSDAYTQALALRRLRALREFVIAKLFKEGSDISSRIDQEDLIWLKDQDPYFYRLFKRDIAYQILDQAEEEIKKIQPLVIFLPFDLPLPEIKKMGQQLRKNYGKYFLIDIKSDPDLIAGAALSWKGVYKDYSLRQRVSSQREEILEKLKGFKN